MFPFVAIRSGFDALGQIDALVCPPCHCHLFSKACKLCLFIFQQRERHLAAMPLPPVLLLVCYEFSKTLMVGKDVVIPPGAVLTWHVVRQWFQFSMVDLYDVIVTLNSCVGLQHMASVPALLLHPLVYFSGNRRRTWVCLTLDHGLLS